MTCFVGDFYIIFGYAYFNFIYFIFYSLLNRFGHLVDLYGWNPHCRYLDGTGPSGTS